MLVKLHTNDYCEDFGILVDNNVIHFMENGITKVSNSAKLLEVVVVNALFLDKDAKIKCHVADTHKKKVLGLQNHKNLDRGKGMYFPYPGGSDVTFHQGSVPYSLDIMFMKDNEIIKIVDNTRVGSKDRWSCDGCDGVIETNGGFCKIHNIDLYDELALIAITKDDMKEFNKEINMIYAMSEVLDYEY